VIPIESSIVFSSNGVMTSGITHIAGTDITLVGAGTRNHSSAAAVTLQTLAGGTQVNANLRHHREARVARSRDRGLPRMRAPR
jgi:hypothetical protein